PGVWVKADKPVVPVAEAQFTHSSPAAAKEVVALVVAERGSVPLVTLKKGVLDNARKAGKDVQVLEEEKRTVNGTEELYLRVNATVRGLPLAYLYYLYSGEAGTVQLVTFTRQQLLFDAFRRDMEALLNGFEVVKMDGLPAARRLPAGTRSAARPA